MNVLIVDTETTGLGDDAEIIEFAAVLYNVKHRTILQQMSTLRSCNENPAFEVNRIEIESAQLMTNELRGSFDMALSFLCVMASKADYIVAHSAEFDKRMIDNYIKNYGPLFEFFDKKWICTKTEFKWPVRKGCLLNLVHIAVDLGVPVVSAHRALTDCILLAQCFDKVLDLEARIKDATLPRFVFKAVVSYDDKDQAKEAGFTWDSEKRAWFKKMTHEEAKGLPFEALQILS